MNQMPSQMNILVVDDTPDSLRLLVEMLTEQGYKVRAAPNGKLALSAAQKIQPDLILLDINMPVMDGYEVCQQLKANQRTSSIPVIFLSAWSDVFDKVKAFSVGGVDYITKPFHIEEVVARIKTHLTLCSLQNALKQRNEDLTQTLNQLTAAQAQLIQAEKMAALGQLVANVAHEINTPLGAIHSSAEAINHFSQNLEQLTQILHEIEPEQWQIFFMLLHRSLESIPVLSRLSTREKRQFKRQLSQQLTAHGVTEVDMIADTLVDIGIYDHVEPFLELLSQPNSRILLDVIYQLTSLQKSTRTILTATDRAAHIVLALKRYVYHNTSGRKTEADVVEGIETALTLHLNQLKRGVDVIRQYADSPSILGFPDELNQLWTNLLSNALHSMDYRGTITIAVHQTKAEVRVDITDTGKGILPELQARIFEPFFTTKPTGEGSGLGLSIVQQIVERHNGRIEVVSQPGQTTFSVFLPREVSSES